MRRSFLFSSIPPAPIECSLYNWATTTYPSTYETMTTQDFISNGIPNAPQLAGCNNAGCCFYNCKRITESPFTITSNNCYDVGRAFYYCTNLITTPTIPYSATNMYQSFYGCTKLIEAPTIPNNVVDMSATFKYCTKLLITCNIPSAVTNMYETFSYARNIAGDMYIYSNIVVDCDSCFTLHNASCQLNIYAHPSSLTYNTFNTYLGGTYSSSLNIYLKTF